MQANRQRLTIHVKVDVWLDEPCDEESGDQYDKREMRLEEVFTKDILLLLQLLGIEVVLNHVGHYQRCRGDRLRNIRDDEGYRGASSLILVSVGRGMGWYARVVRWLRVGE